MKSSKWIIATGVVLSTGILLAGCGSQLLIRQHTHMCIHKIQTR